MNVIQRPRLREFCGTMRDYIIDTDVSITFAVKYGERIVLEEEYVPDADSRVRVRGLGKFCELALWGVWCAGDVSWQNDASGTFYFLINGVQDGKSLVMFSRLQTKKDASAPGVLSEVTSKVTRTGAKEYVSGYLIQNADALKSYGVRITGYGDDGTETSVFLTVTSTAGGVDELVTVDVSADVVMAKMAGAVVRRYKVDMQGGTMMFYVDGSRYAEMWCFRYKNVYDMPETLTCTGGLKMAGGNESELASMWGVERKFGLKVTDEYTVNSGAVMLQSDYRLWHNMLNAQEVDILCGGEWLPIVITKQKYEREFMRSVLKTVEFSFRMANPEQNNLIAYG